jgi:indolepyruvate ferredoxin oxidoreductase, alpha subunit
VLCPSFWRADIVQNPRWLDRALFRFRQWALGMLASPAARAAR